MLSIDVDTRDLDRLATLFRPGGVITGADLGSFVGRVAVESRGFAQATAPVATGTYRGSIFADVRVGSGEAVGRVGSSAPHGRAVNLGRRPGARMPPVARIRAYLAAVGGNPDAAFPVARAIGRRGIPARPNIEPAVVRALAGSERHIAGLLDRIAARLSA